MVRSVIVDKEKSNSRRKSAH